MKKSGENMKKRKIDIFCELLFFVGTPLIVVICTFFVFYVRSNAATGGGIPNIPYPIGIPDIADIQNDISPEIIEDVRSQYITMLSGYGNDVSGNYTIFLGNVDGHLYQIVATNLLVIDDTNFPQTLLYQNSGQHYVEFYYNATTDTLSNGNFYGGWVNTWRIIPLDMFQNGSGWVLASAYNEISGSYSNNVIWKYGVKFLPIGVTPLPDVDDLDNPEIDNPDSPSVPPPPQWDNNKTPIENIGDLIKWLGTVVTTLINNLVSNFKKFFQNLFNNLKKWLQTIKDTIENGFKNLVDNLTSLFQPFFENIQNAIENIREVIEKIKEVIEMFVNPFDSAEFQQTLNNSSFYNGFSSTITSISNFLSSSFSVSEPDSLVLIMDLRNGYYDLGLCEIDFDIIKPYRSIIRGLICALILFEVIFTIINSLNNYIGGNSAKND